MPTAASTTYTGGGLQPAMPGAKTTAVRLKASVAYQQGSILANDDATTAGQYCAYAHGTATVGTSGRPVGILKHACTTDASGNITLEFDQTGTRKDADMYITGTFNMADLPQSGVGGVDSVANMLADNKSWNILSGTDSTAGMLVIG
jgi:hypothetical protein